MKKILILALFLFIPTISFSALKFDAADDLISCGTGDILTENGSLTISAWVNPTVDTILGGDPRIIHRGDSSTYIYLSITPTKAIHFAVSGGTELAVLSSNNVINFNTWQNITVTWNGSTTATNVHIYLNGVETSYQQQTNGVTPSDTAGQTTYIGNRANAGRPFDGQISSVAVWQGTVLGSTDITTLYKGGKWAPLYVATAPSRFWPMMEKSNTTAANSGTIVDMTGNANCTADDGANNTGMTWEYENFNNRGDALQFF